jgi:hypothetical protein
MTTVTCNKRMWCRCHKQFLSGSFHQGARFVPLILFLHTFLLLVGRHVFPIGLKGFRAPAVTIMMSSFLTCRAGGGSETSIVLYMSSSENLRKTSRRDGQSCTHARRAFSFRVQFLHR